MFFLSNFFYLPFYSKFTKTNIPAGGRDVELMGTLFIWFFRPDHVLAATTLCATVQALVTGTASHGYVTAVGTGRRIALHHFIHSIHGIHAAVNLHSLRSAAFYRLRAACS